MTLLMICLMFQEQTKTFHPITEGNVIQVGTFDITVPTGTVYANEDDAPLMFKLAKADYVPNCAGIFFSKSNTFQYCGVIQHVPYQPHTLTPVMPDKYFTDIFGTRHIYNLSTLTGSAEVILPPTYDETEHAFSLGYHYQDTPENTGVFVKKVWVTNQDALLLSIRVDNFDVYQTFEEELTGILLSIAPTGRATEPLMTQPISYLELLGLTEQHPVQSTKMPLVTIIVSVTLALLGIVLLAFAIRLLKKQEKERKETESTAGSDASDKSEPSVLDGA